MQGVPQKHLDLVLVEPVVGCQTPYSDASQFVFGDGRECVVDVVIVRRLIFGIIQ